MERINPIENNHFLPFTEIKKNDLYDLVKSYLNPEQQGPSLYATGVKVKDKVSDLNDQQMAAREGNKAGNKKVALFGLLEIGHTLPAAILALSAVYVGVIKLFGIEGVFQPNLKFLPMIQTGLLSFALAYRNRESSAFLAEWKKDMSVDEQLEYLEKVLGTEPIAKREAEIATSKEIVEKITALIKDKDTLGAEELKEKLNEVHGRAKRQNRLNQIDLASVGSLIVGSVIEIVAPQFGGVGAALSALPLVIKRSKEIVPEVEGSRPANWSDKEVEVMKVRNSRLYKVDLALFAAFSAYHILKLIPVKHLAEVGGILGMGSVALGSGRTVYKLELDRLLFDREALRAKEADPIDNGIKTIKEYGNSAVTWIKSKLSKDTASATTV